MVKFLLYFIYFVGRVWGAKRWEVQLLVRDINLTETIVGFALVRNHLTQNFCQTFPLDFPHAKKFHEIFPSDFCCNISERHFLMQRVMSTSFDEDFP